MKTSEAQELLEAWWNEEPELRWVEILCGKSLRVCVRLFEVKLKPPHDDDPCVIVGEAEAGTIEEAGREAVAKARAATA